MESSQIFYPFTQYYVGTSSCHVGGNSHHSLLSCPCNYLCFLLMILGVQYLMGNSPSFQHITKHFRGFYGYRTYQYRLTFVMKPDYLFNHCIELTPLVLVDCIRIIYSYHWLICRYLHYIQVINGSEFILFSLGSTCHAGQLPIHPEVVLEGYCSQSL